QKKRKKSEITKKLHKGYPLMNYTFNYIIGGTLLRRQVVHFYSGLDNIIKMLQILTNRNNNLP
ncbi:MAG TPA: hypothetical protein QF836_08380, partial [Nitrospinota bacterium]|nr:hypothetical protein [Nitrospinota bacterium]